MTTSVEKQPKCAALLKAEISAEELQAERKNVIKAFSKNVNIPGFRRGKVPAAVIEKRHGNDVKQEVESRLINQAIQEALKDSDDIRVLNIKSPKITTQDNGSVSVEANLITAPEVSLPDYDSLQVEIPKVEVTDEMVDETLTNLQQRFADYEDVEGRAIEQGDLVVVDYTSTIDGKPMDEVAGENAKPLAKNDGYWIKVEEEAFFPGFTDGLIGMNIGDQKDITVTLPEDFPLEVIREKEAVFSVTVKEIKNEVLPELDDEFAKKIDPEQDIEGLKQLIKDDLTNQQERNQQNAKMNGVMEKVGDSADFDVNDEMLQQETQATLNQFTQQSISQGATPEQLKEKQDEIIEKAGAQALRNLRGQFILQKVIEEENLQVQESELVQHIGALAQREKMPIKKFAKQLQKNNQMDNVRSNILMSKAVDFLVSKASFTEVDPVDEESTEDHGE